MKATHQNFRVFDYNTDQPELNQVGDVEEFLSGLGPKRVIGITQTKRVITVWFWESSIPTDINMGVNNRVRCGIKTPAPLFINSPPPPPGTLMCKAS